MLVAGGSTDVTTYFAMRLTADGKAATGLTPADFDMQYVRSGVAPVAKVNATALAATDSTHADNKIIEIDATDAPGLYRVDWPDAAFAAAVREVILTLKVATAFTEHKSVEIDGEVNVVEWAGTDVVAGAIPAAAADAAGGLAISDAGGLDLDAKLANTNEVTVARMAVLTDWIDGGRLDLLLDLILEDTGTDGVIVVTNNDKQGYNAHVDTTIATVTSQTEIILTAGPGDDDALNNMIAVFEDADGDKSQGIRISDYTGGTLTAILAEAPTFTIVATDKVRVYTAATIDDKAAIADAVWDEATAGHVTAGTFGEQCKTDIDDILAQAPRDLLQTTTIATLASQTSFTLTAGSADDDAYNGARIVITDSATATQKAVGLVSDYTGGTLTVTLAADPGIFTMAVGDTVNIMASPKQLDEVTAVRMAALTDWIDGGRLDLLLDAIPTTAMRGTDNAALASVVGALNDAAAAGEVTTADTLVQYIKQLINILIGAPGIVTFPAAADPANGVSIAEVLRRIFDDTDPMTYTKANELDVNTQSINGAEVVGDGNATPWDGA